MKRDKQIESLKKLLEVIETVNALLLQFHDLPILEKVNRQIRHELKRGKNEN